MLWSILFDIYTFRGSEKGFLEELDDCRFCNVLCGSSLQFNMVELQFLPSKLRLIRCCPFLKILGLLVDVVNDALNIVIYTGLAALLVFSEL